MGLEVASFISDLVVTNPVSSDKIRDGDDHLRLLKSVLKATFPQANAAINATPAQMNHLVGVTSAIQTQLNGKAASSHNHNASDINAGTLPVARGGTGVTSSTGTGSTVRSASPTFTGTANFATIAAATITATTQITLTSDRRFKFNIAPIKDALAKVCRMNGYTYESKFEKNGRLRLGVMAQEVRNVLPEVVDENESGQLSVAYGNMVAVLIEAIKELKQEVNDLREQLNAVAEYAAD